MIGSGQAQLGHLNPPGLFMPKRASAPLNKTFCSMSTLPVAIAAPHPPPGSRYGLMRGFRLIALPHLVGHADRLDQYPPASLSATSGALPPPSQLDVTLARHLETAVGARALGVHDALESRLSSHLESGTACWRLTLRHDLGEEPGAALGLIDPHLNHAGGGNVVCFSQVSWAERKNLVNSKLSARSSASISSGVTPSLLLSFNRW